ncbi:hypothetical protein SY83_05015 [Paenibacillus swuensis]|uniref:Major facilitator superfamily (MFS) profile domain-containing protein n=2 Tax=Paenibacillus swuensis TaxID=1178515 RepID=A0A172TP35_9BACL|nr:hypothetical protein SY83_05015 [Paenibacillus swuensis]
MGGLSPGVRIFVMTECLFGVGIGLFSLVLNLHLLDLGYDEGFIGRLTSIGSLAMGLLSLPAGLAVRVVGRKGMLASGMLCVALGMAGFGAVTAPWAMYVSQLLWSVGMTAIVVSEIQLVFQYCRDKQEERRAYAVLFAAFTLFTGAGTLLGGLLPRWLQGGVTPYEPVFYAAAGSLALGGVLRALLLPSVTSASEREQTAAAAVSPEQAAAEGAAVHAAAALEQAKSGAAAERRQAKSGAGSRISMLASLSAMIFLSGLALGFLNNYLNIILKYRLDWPDSSISIVLSIAGVFLFAGSLLAPMLLERVGTHQAFGLLFIGNAAVVLLLAWALPPMLFTVLLLLRGGLFIMWNNQLDSELMSAVPEEDRNLYAGLRTIARSGGTAIAAYAAGWILAGSNYTLPFVWSGVTILIGFVFYMVRIRPILDKPKSAAET